MWRDRKQLMGVLYIKKKKQIIYVQKYNQRKYSKQINVIQWGKDISFLIFYIHLFSSLNQFCFSEYLEDYFFFSLFFSEFCFRDLNKIFPYCVIPEIEADKKKKRNWDYFLLLHRFSLYNILFVGNFGKQDQLVLTLT